jgi:predicted permease
MSIHRASLPEIRQPRQGPADSQAFSPVESARARHEFWFVVGILVTSVREEPMLAFVRDLRYGTRALRANAGFTLASTATIAIAVGATAAMFSIVHPVLLLPLPFAQPDRLVAIDTFRFDAPERTRGASLQELRDWKERTHTIAAFAGWRDWGMSRHDGTPAESVYGAIVTPAIFAVFPVRPELGRLFNEGDDVAGKNQIVLLSDSYWRTRFGGDPHVVGRTMVLERGPRAAYTVVGVLPAAFSELPSFEDVQVFALSSIDPDAARGRELRNRRVFARMRGNTSIEQSRQDMQRIGRQLAQEYPDSNGAWDVTVRPLIQEEVGPIGGALRMLFVAVGFVLLIACTNVAALQLARALSRRHEFAIRQAIGGSRLDLARSLIAEGLLIAVLGSAPGLVLATWLLDAILASGPAIPRAVGVTVDLSVLLFTALVCLAAGILVALPASILTTRNDLSRGLREDAGRIPNVRAQRSRSIFVGVQLALALILLTGAVLSARTFAALLTVRPGFVPENLAMISVVAPLEKKGQEVAALYARALEEIRRVPNVQSTAAASAGPLFGGVETLDVRVEGGASTDPALPARYFNIAPDFFKTMGVSLHAGRDFTAEDHRGSTEVAIVNDAFAQQLVQSREAIGARVILARGGDVVTIVGVVSNIVQDLRGRSAASPEIYFPYAQQTRWAAYVVVRSDNLAVTLPLIANRVRATDPSLRVGSPIVMADSMVRARRAPRFTMLLLGGFALVALLLSAIGVYGLVSYSTAQRTREIGVRLSLGAGRRDILALLARSGLLAIVAGSAAGIAGTIVINRLMRSALPLMEPLGAAAILVAWVALVSVGIIACYIPARRALRIDPAAALRSP